MPNTLDTPLATLRDRLVDIGKSLADDDEDRDELREMVRRVNDTRKQLAAFLGLQTLAIVADIGVQDGIQAVRMMLPRCWFHVELARLTRTPSAAQPSSEALSTSQTRWLLIQCCSKG